MLSFVAVAMLMIVNTSSPGVTDFTPVAYATDFMCVLASQGDRGAVLVAKKECNYESLNRCLEDCKQYKDSKTYWKCREQCYGMYCPN